MKIAALHGETTENIDWVLDRLKSVGLDLNSKDVATISDERKAILKAINIIHYHCNFI